MVHLPALAPCGEGTGHLCLWPRPHHAGVRHSAACMSGWHSAMEMSRLACLVLWGLIPGVEVQVMGGRVSPWPEDMPRVKSQAAGAPTCPRPGPACSLRSASDSRGGPAPVSSVSFLFATFLAWHRQLVRGTMAAGQGRHPGCLWSLVLAFPL